ncbi:MAG: hypothetical protein GC154_13875 [bacterium]|nr:hypothetical protein [bacterium]
MNRCLRKWFLAVYAFAAIFGGAHTHVHFHPGADPSIQRDSKQVHAAWTQSREECVLCHFERVSNSPAIKAFIGSEPAQCVLRSAVAQTGLQNRAPGALSIRAPPLFS